MRKILESYGPIAFFLLVVLAGVLLFSRIFTSRSGAQAAGTQTVVQPTKAAKSTDATGSIADAGCTVVSQAVTPEGTQSSFLPAIQPSDWVDGPETAGVTFLEYCDFQSSQCGALAKILTYLRQELPQDVRVVYRYFPLAKYDKSSLAAQAAEAAGKIGGKDQFWAMANMLFNTQTDWQALNPTNFPAWLMTQAKTLGVDEKAFGDAFGASQTVQKIKTAQDDGIKLGLAAVPLIQINGQIYSGPIDPESLWTTTQLLLLPAHQFHECPPFSIDSTKQYIARLKTEKGDIVIQLYANKAPATVNNFVFLARQGFYDGMTFFQVVPNYTAQTGDPSGTGFGGPGYFIADEFASQLKFDQAGVVAMFNSGPGSNGSQFFISLAALPDLNGKYPIFGQVIDGMDVVKNLTSRRLDTVDLLKPGDKVLKVLIEEK